MGLIIRLFGVFSVRRDGEGAPIPPSEWPDRKSCQILKILLCEPGRCFYIDELIEWLWPDSDLRKATSSLRNRISQLRRVLEPGLKRGDRSRYIQTCWDRGYRFVPEGCTLDTLAFEHLAREGRALQREGLLPEALRKYEQAAALYRGDFLGEDRYEGWAAPYQERWRERYLRLLARISQGYLQRGEPRRAVEWAEGALDCAPAWSEALYRTLMLSYAALQDGAGLMRTYRRLKRMLRETYQIRPSAETEELLARLIEELYPPCSSPCSAPDPP